MQAYNKPHRRSYYPELDGVRALAAIMVILFHLAQMGIPLRGPSAFGETGVDLFFVLSGFLITGILLNARQNDWSEVRAFYIRRTLRIFPLYYTYLLVAALLGTVISAWYWVYLQNVVIALGSPMGGIGHFWSLAVEEQFYLFWPFVVLFLPRKLLEPTLWFMLVFTVLARLALVETTHIQVYYLTVTRLDGLAAGGLLAVYKTRDQLLRKRRSLWILAGLSFLLIAWQGIKYHGAARPLVQVTKFSLIACFYASLVGLLLTQQKPNMISRFLASRPMRFIGGISYGLYVFHPQILRITFARLQGRSHLIQAVAGLVATLTITLLSWYLLERPFLRLKDRFTPDPALRSPTQTASLSSTP